MSETYKKIIINGIGAEPQIVDFTPEEVAQKETDKENAKVKEEAFKAKLQEQEDLKASAKAKLIAGEALTEEEANTIVL